MFFQFTNLRSRKIDNHIWGKCSVEELWTIEKFIDWKEMRQRRANRKLFFTQHFFHSRISRRCFYFLVKFSLHVRQIICENLFTNARRERHFHRRRIQKGLKRTCSLECMKKKGADGFDVRNRGCLRATRHFMYGNESISATALPL